MKKESRTVNRQLFQLRTLLSKTKKTAPHRDLKEIKESGKLVALTDFSSSSYFIYKGIPMGFEYDLLERYCTQIGVDLSIQVVEDMDEIIGMLKNDKEVHFESFYKAKS